MLEIAGPEEGERLLRKPEAMVNQFELKGRVGFGASHYDDAKWSAYRDADSFILPSQNDNP